MTTKSEAKKPVVYIIYHQYADTFDHEYTEIEYAVLDEGLAKRRVAWLESDGRYRWGNYYFTEVEVYNEADFGPSLAAK